MLGAPARVHRALKTGAVVACSSAAALVTCSWSPAAQEQRYVDYCATMPDAVGLYIGNPVTQMGYKVGEVRTITPAAGSVRVDFKVNEDRPLPADVRAVTRSPSIL